MRTSPTRSMCGVLIPKMAQKKFRLTRYLPAPELRFFVEFYWIIHWDLRDQPPHTQETLPYPSVNLVFERSNTLVFGVVSGKFDRTLVGKGEVFGVKYRPGAFYPFLNTPVSNLTDRTISFYEVFKMRSEPLERAILPLDDELEMVEVVNAFLRPRLPEPDETITFINQMIDCVVDDRTITRVDDIASRFNISGRTLQRLFRQYVGVSPKWVIQRYRLQEAAEQLATGKITDWPKLALELGYFDQAHFIKDFKAMIGSTPAEYARAAGSY